MTAQGGRFDQARGNSSIADTTNLQLLLCPWEKQKVMARTSVDVKQLDGGEGVRQHALHPLKDGSPRKWVLTRLGLSRHTNISRKGSCKAHQHLGSVL